MNTTSIITASMAGRNLYKLIDEVRASHHPKLITGKRGNAVLISEEDWQAIQETLALLSSPRLTASIKEGMDTPLDECAEGISW